MSLPPILAVGIILAATLPTVSAQNPGGAAAGATSAGSFSKVVNPATDGKVWGALVYATNDPATLTGAKVEAPADYAALSRRLAKVFPYQHFELLGHHLQDVFREYESWVVPVRELFLKIDSKGPAKGGGMSLHLQFWREQQVLVKTDATLRADSPLFIGGPKWREGQLIFVLELQR